MPPTTQRDNLRMPQGHRGLATLWAATMLTLAAGCSDDSTLNNPGTGAGQADGANDFKGSLTGLNDLGSLDVGGGPSDAKADLKAADLKVGPADFGTPCTQNDDCQSGYCVQSPEGKVCSKECTSSCDDGWTCSQVPGGADTKFICIPKFLHLCQPCVTSSECNENGGVDHKCVPQDSEGSFCGAACNPAGSDCPTGYSCTEIVDPDTGKATNQCSPTTKKCNCSAVARSRKASTGCAVKNQYGTCKGQRTCGPAGLSKCDAETPSADACDGIDNDCDGNTDNLNSQAKCASENEFGKCDGGVMVCKDGGPACSAPQPKPEGCNGIDDDCDGKTDEGLCDDGNPCTVDSCNTDGSCKNQVPPNAGCDDGDACTASDKCLDGKCVAGGALDCDDKKPCTDDSCDVAKGCIHTSVDANKPCPDDGNPCTFDGCDGLGKCAHTTLSGICTISGQCVAAGSIDPANPCKVCNPLQSKTTYVLQSGLACDDGDVCTVSDKCTSGKCSGKPMDCTAKDGACTEGLCNQGACMTAPKLGNCDDGNFCTDSDQCINGVCAGTPKDCSKFDGTCTVGTCQGGACAAQPKPNSCDDGDPCTVGDSCGAGGCNGTPMNCSALNSSCGKGVCNGGQCSATPANSGAACDDGNPCTVGDLCGNGTCNGSAKDCSYLNDACGTGSCSAGQCVKSGGAAVCKPGEVQSQSQGCGNCGTQSQTRTCTASCGWGAWSGWGTCTSQGACKPGATETASQGCGNCGTQSHTRTCNASCAWGAYGGWSTCTSQGVCLPGAVDGNCGDPCQSRTCSGSCAWGACGLKSGAQCLWKNGSNFQCCGVKKWQFCSKVQDGTTAACHWYPCQSTTSACF